MPSLSLCCCWVKYAWISVPLTEQVEGISGWRCLYMQELPINAVSVHMPLQILAYRVDASTPPVNVTINQTGIAWKTDRQQNFGAHSAANFNAEPVHRGGATVTGDDGLP